MIEQQGDKKQEKPAGNQRGEGHNVGNFKGREEEERRGTALQCEG